MSRRANPLDNAPMESFFHTLKTELVHHRTNTTRNEAKRDLSSYIEGFYNRQRLHSALDYRTPDQAERQAASGKRSVNRPRKSWRINLLGPQPGPCYRCVAMNLKLAMDAGLTMEHAFSGRARPEPVTEPPPTTTGPEAIELITPVIVDAPAEPVLLTAPALTRRRPWYRAAGRSMLGMLRPLALPVLNRADHRMRWAMDRSHVASRLAEVERKAEAAADRAAAAGQDTELRVTARLDALAHAATRFEQSLVTVGDTLEAMHMDVSAQAAALRRSQEFENQVRERLDLMVTQLGETGGWVDARMAERIGALDHQLAAHMESVGRAVADQIMSVERNSAQRLAPLQIAVEKLDARSDLLVQRNVIGLGQDIAIRTGAGYILAPAEDPAVLVGLIEGRGQLEHGTTVVLQALLQPGNTMVDVGGHIGTLSLPAARGVGPSGRVIVIEPAPRLADLLRRTMVLNHINWVEVHECAAGDAEGTARFALSAQTGHNSLFQTGDTVQEIDVRVRPLDALIPPCTRIDVVKIDAEGAELQVWRGMRRIVADNPRAAILLEFGPSHLQRVGTSIADWFAEITAAGHTPWEIDEETGRLRPLRTAGLDEVFSFNVLLLRGPPANRGLVVG